MTPAASSRRRAPAFTLIEVLLAVAVFAIVLAAINTVFFGALRLRNKTHEAFERALPLEHAVATIQRDLDGLLPPGGTFSGQFQSTPTNFNSGTSFVGTRVSPDIFTCTGSVDETSPWADVQKVAYYLANPTNDSPGRDLIRSVSRNPLPMTTVEEPEAQWLMGGVENLTLQYYDGRAWAMNWDSSLTTNLPLAIKVQIYLSRDARRQSLAAPVEFIVPVMVQARTNRTATTSGGGT